MSIVTTRPDIRSVTIAPNPVNINSVFTIAVKVEDISITLEPESRYSGEFYLGEDE